MKEKTSRLRNIEQNLPTKIIPKLEKAVVCELVCKTDALPFSGKLMIIFFNSKYSDHLPWEKMFVGTCCISTRLLIILLGCNLQPAF